MRRRGKRGGGKKEFSLKKKKRKKRSVSGKGDHLRRKGSYSGKTRGGGKWGGVGVAGERGGVCRAIKVPLVVRLSGRMGKKKKNHTGGCARGGNLRMGRRLVWIQDNWGGAGEREGHNVTCRV